MEGTHQDVITTTGDTDMVEVVEDATVQQLVYMSPHSLPPNVVWREQPRNELFPPIIGMKTRSFTTEDGRPYVLGRTRRRALAWFNPDDPERYVLLSAAGRDNDNWIRFLDQPEDIKEWIMAKLQWPPEGRPSRYEFMIWPADWSYEYPGNRGTMRKFTREGWGGYLLLKLMRTRDDLWELEVEDPRNDERIIRHHLADRLGYNDFYRHIYSIMQNIDEIVTEGERAGDLGTINIIVSGGVVQEVEGLPSDWTYEVFDQDNDPFAADRFEDFMAGTATSPRIFGIFVRGGVVQDVANLPPGYDYDITDLDEPEFTSWEEPGREEPPERAERPELENYMVELDFLEGNQLVISHIRSSMGLLLTNPIFGKVFDLVEQLPSGIEVWRNVENPYEETYVATTDVSDVAQYVEGWYFARGGFISQDGSFKDTLHDWITSIRQLR